MGIIFKVHNRSLTFRERGLGICVLAPSWEILGLLGWHPSEAWPWGPTGATGFQERDNSSSCWCSGRLHGVRVGSRNQVSNLSSTISLQGGLSKNFLLSDITLYLTL